MSADGMPVDAFGAEKNLRRCAGEIQRLADMASTLADDLEREREDARNLLIRPLSGIDKHEATGELHRVAGLIFVEAADGGYTATSGPLLHSFIGRFGASYGNVPPSRSTVTKFWGHPVDCSPKTRQAVLRGIFSAIDSAQEEVGGDEARLIQEARRAVEGWCDAYFMTERHVTERIESVARRLSDIAFIAKILGLTNEAGVSSVKDFAAYVSPLHVGEIDSLWNVTRE